MNNTFYSENDYRYYLAHHGVKGMRWGVRRFQNADGSYTSAGKSRYGVGDGESYSGVKGGSKTRFSGSFGKASKKQLTPEERAARNAKIRKAAIAVGAVAATAAIAYAGHKYMKDIDAEVEKYMQGQKDHTLGAWSKFMTQQNNQVNVAERRMKEAIRDTGRYSKTSLQERKYFEQARNMRDGFQKDQLWAMRKFDENMSDKKVRNAARRELIKRDIDMAPYKLTGKLREARGSKLDPVSVQFSSGDKVTKARARVEDLALKGQNSAFYKNRDRYYSAKRLKDDAGFVGREAVQTAKYKLDQHIKKKR